MRQEAAPHRAHALAVWVCASTDKAIPFAVGRTNMSTKAESLGFILLYPQGTTGYRGTCWNAGTCCDGPAPGVDDLGFVSDLIALLQESFLIRPESIHSMGFSNGGFFSETIACSLPAIRSIASVSGGTILRPGMDAGLRECDTRYAALGAPGVSVLHVHGDADPVVRFQGDPTSPNFFAPVPEQIQSWVDRNECTGAPVQTLNVTTFTNQVWSGCFQPNMTVELVVNAGGGHLYPMDPTKGFMVTDYIIDFMNARTPNGL